MPEISNFYGIIITMLFDDHNPPHFHVKYGENRAVIKYYEYEYGRIVMGYKSGIC